MGDGTTGAQADTSGSDTGYTDDNITVYGDQSSTTTPYVAWTDPTTGLQYDVDGNLIQ
jgi:hypothetical protein